MKKKLVYVISHIDKALAFEWIAASEELKAVCDVSFVLLNKEEGHLYSFLINSGLAVHWMPYRGKKDLLPTIWRLYRYFKQKRVDIVHAHLFDAGVAGLFAARMAGIVKRIYTRHHATMHHTYYPRAVYYDQLINSLATQVVAISKNVGEVLQIRENVSENKIVLIHHGFDISYFSEVSHERIERVSNRHKLLNITGLRIGVISRYIHLKGIEYIIEAFALVRKEYPDAHLILANARGDYQHVIREKLRQLPLGSYTEIAFENDLPALYKIFDIYVHTPIDHHSEAFGQTYVEALAAGIPSIFTLSGVASEFIEDGKNALVVPFKDSYAIYSSVLDLADNQDLRNMLIENGYTSVSKKFTLYDMIDKLIKLYTC